MRAAPLLAYLAICVIWGSTFLALRIGVETIPPVLMIAIRSLIAGLVLTGACAAARVPFPDRAGWITAALSGALMFCGGQALLAWGEMTVPSGQAALLNATLALFLPFCTWALGTAAFPRPLAIGGLLLGMAGVAVLARPGPAPIDPAGAAATIAAAFFFALGSAVTRRRPPTASVFLTAGLQLIAGGLANVAAALPAGEYGHFHLGQISATSFAAFLYLIVFGSLIAFTAFAWLVQIWPPDRLATYTFVNPVVALAIGAAIHEPVGAREVVAMAIILAAVALVMHESPARRIARRAAEGAD